MLRRTSLVVVTLLLPALWTPAHAQPASRWYAGAVLGAHAVDADDVDTGALGAVGGLIGVRLTSSIGLELGLDQRFGELSRVYEAFGTSFAPADSTLAEIERLGVYQRFETYWTPRSQLSGVVVWHRPAAGRIRLSIFGGVTNMRYTERRAITVLRFPSGIDPSHPMLRNQAGTRISNRGGLTGGLFVPIAIGRDLTVAPEVRFMFGSIADEIHNVFSAGVRTLWRF